MKTPHAQERRRLARKKSPDQRADETHETTTPQPAQLARSPLDLQRVVGNRAAQGVLQREGAPGIAAPPLPRLDPATVLKIIEERDKPIREWLESNVSPDALISVIEVMRLAWRNCPQAREISFVELKKLVEDWGKAKNVNFLAFPLLEGPGFEAALTLVLPSKEGETRIKADAKGIKTEFEVPFTERISFGLSLGADKATVSATLDIMPDGLKRLQDAAKIRTGIGTFKLKLSSELSAEIEAKAAEADGKRKASAALKGEAGAAVQWQIGQMPIFLSSGVKAGVELGPEGVKPGVEFTPLKFELKF